MDVISHGLWGGAAFGRKNRKKFFLAFGFGIMPDILSFGILLALNILGLVNRPNFPYGPPDPNAIPVFVSTLYSITHSLVIFALIFLLVWFARKNPLWELGAWGLHILIDIPSHSSDFFPTPFLWPISDFIINGIRWSNPAIYYPNLILLLVIYLWIWLKKHRQKNNNPK